MKKITFNQSLSTGLNSTGQSNSFHKGGEYELEDIDAKRHVTVGAAKYSDKEEQAAHEKEQAEASKTERVMPLTPPEPVAKGPELLVNEDKRSPEGQVDDVYTADDQLEGVHKAIKKRK